jgi:hypothetical protein
MQTNRTLPDAHTRPARMPRVPTAAIALVMCLTMSPPGTSQAHWAERTTLKLIPDDGGGQTGSATSFAWAEGTVQAQQIESRLAELRMAAVDESTPWSDESEAGLRDFLSTYRRPTRPMIVHLANGNLRAIWKQGRERHVGLQFIGPNDIQYVVLNRRPGADFLSQMAGRDSVEGVIGHLKSAGLYDLIIA